jgi:adenine-specific DNA-methyltransferase
MVLDPTGLTPRTREVLARSDPARRKALGQFFTPEPLREALLERLPLGRAPRILDPACGTGEFLLSAARRWPDAELVGWDVDPAVLEAARDLAPGAAIRRRDALRAAFRPSFDAVIGNPPYFEFRPDATIRRRYEDAISGRVNAYALFVMLGVELLRPGGWLAYVVSSSMTNGAFFRSLREYLLERCAVEWLSIPADTALFEGAQQQVVLLVVRKGGTDRGRHIFRRNGHVLLAERPEELEALYEGRTTLGDLGWDVRTGTVVWNQRRDDLTDDPRDAVRLIWSHQVGEGELRLDETRGNRPAFVRNVTPRTGPAVVVNRVTGAGRRARLRAAVVPRGMRFVAENHVNVAFPPFWGAEARAVERIARSLRDPAAAAAVRRITGNTQISRTELRDLVPVAV